MKKKSTMIDGFIPRRPSEQLGELHDESSRKVFFGPEEDRQLNSSGTSESRSLGQPIVGNELAGFDADGSLRSLDIPSKPVKKLSRRQRRQLEKQAIKRPRSILRRIIKWLIVLVVLAILSAGGYTAYKFVSAGQSIFQGSILNIFKNVPLKQDSNGRSAVLILGTSEDDPGHEGAYLTDSMLVVSIDQTNKNAYMFSVPRDLYVNYGTACFAGYSGKINGFFSCSNSGTTPADEQDRLAKTQKLIGDIFGIEIQYGVHVNQTVIKEAVDALGGIDVDVQGSNGASGVLDRNADWRCNYTCYYVKYDNGVYHLDGIHALYLSMARGDAVPTYGLGNSNFDREVNQQKILIAMRDKALSTGTLTNLGAVTSLIKTLGDNLRTNIQTDEISTIMQVASEIDINDITTISLVGENSVVTTGMVNGSSVVVPRAGTYEYSDIRDLIFTIFSSNPISHEAAPVVVLNGTGQAGLGQTEADKLTSLGFTISLVDNAPGNSYAQNEVYQIGSDNEATASKLTNLYGVAIKNTAPPVTVNGDVRFVVIIGVATN